MFSLDRARDFAMSTLSAVSSIKTSALMTSDPLDNDMKGLHNFIMRVRLCNSSEDEDKIVNQELAKIRSNFKNPVIDGYTKKKSICKLLYVFLLGKPVTFGQSEALSLLSSNILAEKQIGYLFISILFNPKSDTNALLIKCIQSDLELHNPKFVCLAIHCIANTGNKEMSVSLSSKILDIVKKKTAPDFVIQSALLCLLKLARVSDVQPICPDLASEVLTMMSQGNLGVVFNAISLLNELIKVDAEFSSKRADIFRIVVSELRRILSEIRPGLHEYRYGTVPAPWHLVSLMRVLKNFGVPDDDYSKHMLEEVVNTILDKVQEPVDTGKIRGDAKCTNARYAVFFEAVGVIVQNTENSKLWSRAQVFSSWLLGHKICNFRYLALEALSQLAATNFCSMSMEGVQKKAIVYLEKETDPSIQQRAVEFLCSMSNHTNVMTIVEDLLHYTKNPECANRGAVAVQIATMAEKAFPDYTWYIGTLIQLIATVGDVVDDKICSKVVQLVSARSDIQKFAADVAFKALMEPYPHEKLLIVASFILGDFGHLISNTDTAALMQFQILKSKYAHCRAETKAMVLSSFLKMAHKRAVLKKPVSDLFLENSTSCDLEVQKRSVEYLKLLESTNNGFLSAVLRALPSNESEQRFIGDGSNSSEIQRPRRGSSSRGDAADTQTIFIQVPSDFGAFVPDDKGVLYDDALLKITLDSSYHGSTGHMTVSLESKFQSVPTFSNPKLLTQDSNLAVKLQQKNQRKSKRVDLNFSFECHQVFDQQPRVYTELFVDNSVRIKILLTLPVLVNKFFEPVPMTEQLFRGRYDILETQSTAIDRYFRSLKLTNLHDLKSLLTNTNVSLLLLQETNPGVYVFGCGGLFQTSLSKIGFLIRLEVDALIQEFRMCVRSPNSTLAIQVAELLQSALL